MLYSAGSGVNSVQVRLVGSGCMLTFAMFMSACGAVMVMSIRVDVVSCTGISGGSGMSEVYRHCRVWVIGRRLVELLM